MRFIRALHKWVGLIAGAQLCLWLISGLMMSLLDHHVVSGDSTVRKIEAPPTFASVDSIVEPHTLAAHHEGESIREIGLQRQLDRWVWRVQTNVRAALYDAATGAPVFIDEVRARALAADERAGDALPARATQLIAPTLEARGHEGPLWRLDFNDAQQTRYYIATDDGRIVARRTGDWRIFDFFWMLHTMDYRGRDDFSNPLSVTFAVLALWLSLTGVLLLSRIVRPLWARIHSHERG